MIMKKIYFLLIIIVEIKEKEKELKNYRNSHPQVEGLSNQEMINHITKEKIGSPKHYLTI
jgi:hypothetical protein